jgi:hypothetical protein
MKMRTALMAMGFAGAALAPGADAQITPCSHHAPLSWTLSFPRSSLSTWLHSLPAYRIWGTQNMAVRQAGSVRGLEVMYPQGSIDPATTTVPVGGAGFVYTSPAALSSGCLAYDVAFEPGFEFAKGGKLPGLYGGDAPSGGADTSRGFSTRYMWRTGGAGEVYAYVPEKAGEYGESISPGAWTFKPGRWQRLEQEVIVNHLGAFDGVLRVWVDGELVVNRSDMLYRVTDNVLVAGLMFSTFFGGHDPSWASPRTQSAFFRNFEFFGGSEMQ